MKRKPNPWILVPGLSLGGLVGWLGFLVTNVSCRAEQPPPAPGCPVMAAAIGVAIFVGATIGMVVVLALTARSIAEHRDRG